MNAAMCSFLTSSMVDGMRPKVGSVSAPAGAPCCAFQASKPSADKLDLADFSVEYAPQRRAVARSAPGRPEGFAGAFGLGAGCFTVAWSAALLDFFLRYCNAPRGKLTTELGRSAYAGYVILPLIVVPLVAAYLAILRGPWETEVDFPPGSSKSSTPMAEGKLVLGFATVMPLSLVLTWTVAAGFRRLPVLRDVF